MSNQRLIFKSARATPRTAVPIPLGRDLIERNVITPWQLFYALRCQRRWNATLSEILRSRGWVSDTDLRAIESEHATAQQVDLDREPPDPKLGALLSPEFCLKHCLLPWARVGGLLILAIGRPDRLETIRAQLPAGLSGALVVIAEEGQIIDRITRTHRTALTELAETRVEPRFSCRGLNQRSPWQSVRILTICAVVCVAAVLFPKWVLTLLSAWAFLSLMSAATLKGLAFALYFKRPRRDPAPPPPADSRLPRISVMVPLFREKEIAHALIRRLTRLTYPRALLDVVLVLEEKDSLTRETVARANLPKWMRVVEVPCGSGLTTKPRALNYALDFCKGDIIGIWDAEDAPAPDQLEQVAAHFARAEPDVACLQGVLDYYNPYTNWISRCFTIEYSTWFRVILPGLARLGMAIPLGGTTLFLRREAIEQVRGWDAHNVTEDADLGYRLARLGYRTELVRTVTGEEANCRPIAWVRQRSRWLKGFMVTYLVHMRNPVRLWRDLGSRRFVGFHLVFMTTLTQFVLAPVIWSFWGALFGMPHPLAGMFSQDALFLIALLLFGAGLLNTAISAAAIWGQGRAPLFAWLPVMFLYFPMATLAAYKALIELVVAPFYWDKTAHGKTEEGTKALLPDLSHPVG